MDVFNRESGRRSLSPLICPVQIEAEVNIQSEIANYSSNMSMAEENVHSRKMIRLLMQDILSPELSNLVASLSLCYAIH